MWSRDILSIFLFYLKKKLFYRKQRNKVPKTERVTESEIKKENYDDEKRQ